MSIPDLRTNLTDTQQWICELVAGLRPEQLDRPTPCSEFTVAGLIEHLFGVQLRLVAYATDRAVGDTPATVPLRSSDPAELAAQLGELADRSRQGWDRWSSEEMESQTVSGPFGVVPGAVALAIMTSENMVHGWDLAVATDQPSEADPQTASILLQLMQRALPAEPRGGEVPFAPPVPTGAEAGPTERLAAWAGHSRAA